MGIFSPLIPSSTRGESRIVERQDYIGTDLVQLTPGGRPVMAVVTTRDDGEDCTIFAPCASLGMKANGLDQ